MSRPSKARIRQSFERAASTYDSAAEVQRRICTQLAAGLPDGLSVHRLLDAGCGTGFAQSQLQQRFPLAQALALDLSPGMLQQIAMPCCRLAGDIEHLPFADHCIDLYWSSLSVQWCDLNKALAEAQRILQPQGKLAVASLGGATFKELRQAFSQVDQHRHTLSFHTPEEIERMAKEAGFATVDVQNRPEIAYYPDFRTLLKAVKAIGANQLGDGRRTSLMSRSAFAQAEAAFEIWRTPLGLPLTYDVVYLYGSAR
jgi:malonyl-CoA O-methyltransferase